MYAGILEEIDNVLVSVKLSFRKLYVPLLRCNPYC